MKFFLVLELHRDKKNRDPKNIVMQFFLYTFVFNIV